MTSLTTTDVIEQAEQWYDCVAIKKASGRQIKQFKEWYESDRRHQIAYAEVYVSRESGLDFSSSDIENRSVATGNLINLRDDEIIRKKRVSLTDRLIPQSSHKPWWLTVGFAAILLGLFVLFQPVLQQNETRIYRTQISEIRTINLEDGSTVTLGAGSSIAVPAFEGEQRGVILEYGEALFSVSGNSNSPFIVSADNTRVQVLGTRFNINRSHEVLTLSLLEGKVRVIHSAPENQASSSKITESVEIMPAQSVSVRNGVLQPVKNQNPEEMASWVQGQLRYNSTPLGRVVSDLNRYSEKPVQIASKTLQTMPVTAVLGTDQINIFVEGLPHLLPVRISRDSSGGYIILPES